MAKMNHYTYREFVDFAVNRKRHDKCRDEYSRQTKDPDWAGTKDFEQAVSFARNGWDLGLEQYKIEDGLLVGGSTLLDPSMAGCLPHVQNHIMGFPEQMYQLHDEREYNFPTLDIVVNLSYNGGFKQKNALEFGKSLVAYINARASTRNIRLTGVFATNQPKGQGDTYDVIHLKNFDEAMVINNIAFAFHPSFFRRIKFSTIEAQPYWSDGYGCTIRDYKPAMEKEVKKRGGTKPDETIYFKSFADISGGYSFTPDDINRVTL
jgi:hypothetical protein